MFIRSALVLDTTTPAPSFSFGGGTNTTQPAPTNAFGGTSTGFGTQNQPPTSTFGQPATSTFGASTSGFGTSNTTGAFGGTGGTFGNTGNTGGLFGAKPAFGATASAPTTGTTAGGIFGAAKPATGIFGSSKCQHHLTICDPYLTTISATTATPATGQGTASPAYAATQERDSTVGGAATTLHYQSITAMPAYRNSSFEVSIVFNTSRSPID